MTWIIWESVYKGISIHFFLDPSLTSLIDIFVFSYLLNRLYRITSRSLHPPRPRYTQTPNTVKIQDIYKAVGH